MGVHSAKLNVVCVSENSWGGSGISCLCDDVTIKGPVCSCSSNG